MHVVLLYVVWKRGFPLKFASFVLFCLIKKRSFNLLCVLDLSNYHKAIQLSHCHHSCFPWYCLSIYSPTEDFIMKSQNFVWEKTHEALPLCIGFENAVDLEKATWSLLRECLSFLAEIRETAHFTQTAQAIHSFRQGHCHMLFGCVNQMMTTICMIHRRFYLPPPPTHTPPQPKK